MHRLIRTFVQFMRADAERSAGRLARVFQPSSENAPVRRPRYANFPGTRDFRIPRTPAIRGLAPAL